MFGTKRRPRLAANWLAVLAMFLLAAVGRTQSYRLGISTSAIEYSSRAFTNMLSMDARVWLPGTTELAPVDASGMPLVDCDIYILDGTYAQNYQAYGFNGTYRLIFNGQADVTAGGGVLQNKTYSATTNTTTADLVVTDPYPTLGIRLLNTRRTASSAPNSGVTGLKLMRPLVIGSSTSYPPQAVFTQEFLDLHNRGEVLRSMDFVATNGNIQSNWNDRNLPDTLCFFSGAEGYWWQGKGAPWEFFIDLCNTVHRDAWINVPVLASDDYVTQLARLLKTRLNPDRKIYLEYSNEIWNFAFPTWYQVADIAEAEVRNVPSSSLNFDGACMNNDGSFVSGVGVPRFWARRTMQISDIFRAEFGDAAMHDGSQPRVFPLFETQASWQTWIYSGLTFLDRYYNNSDGAHVASPRPVPSMIWGGGGSGYLAWFPEEIFNDPNATVDDIFRGYEQSWSHQYEAMVPSTDWCAAFGLKRVAYEGGLAAFDGGPARTASLAAQLDPRMKDAWKRCADEFFRAGGELYMQYLGVRPDYGLQPFDAVKGTQPTPKLDGFDELSASSSRPSPTIGSKIPGVLNAGRYSVASDGWSTGTSDNPLFFGSGYTWASYTIRSDRAQPVTVRLTASESSGGEATIFISGRPAGTVLLSTGATSNSVTANIPVGVSGIRIQRTSGTFSLQSIAIDSAPALTVSFDPPSVVSGGKSKATVSISSPAPAGGQVISLSASPSVVVPASVKIAAGSLSTAFYVTAGTVDKTIYANVSAAAGDLNTSTKLTIVPVKIIGLSVHPSSFVGGTKTSITLTLSKVMPVDVRLSTSVDNADALSCPTSVVVKAGTPSITFTLNSHPVRVKTAVNLTAAYGATSKGVVLNVSPPTMSSFTVSPFSVWGGTSANGKIKLTGIAPKGGILVAVKAYSSKTIVPATVLVPEGAKEVTFSISTVLVATDVNGTIKATYDGKSISPVLKVKAPVITGLVLHPATVIGRSADVVTATIAIAPAAPSCGLNIQLLSSETGVASVPAKVKIAPGATSATFVVSHYAVTTSKSVVITASVNASARTAKLKVTK